MHAPIGTQIAGESRRLEGCELSSRLIVVSRVESHPAQCEMVNPLLQ